MNTPPVDLVAFLKRYSPASRYWIAYSGGLDSRVLLHLAAGLPDDFRIAAVHVHHGLQSAADAWPKHCGQTAASAGIEFRLLRIDASARRGQSPEEAARDARYGALRKLIGPDEALLTAQHRDDQAETLLLQLLRGAGLAGLSGMAESSPFGSARLLRPLLDVARRDLRAYAEAHGLQWLEDPSNRDLRFDRNFIRHQLLPLLEQRWPAATGTLARSAGHCAEAQARLNSLAQDLLNAASDEDRGTLDTGKLLEWPDPDRRLVLRAWFASRGLRMPSAAVIDRILNEGLTAAPDRNPVIRWSEAEVRRYRDRLYLMKPSPARQPAAGTIPWDGHNPLTLTDDGLLRVEMVSGPGISVSEWSNRKITVGFRVGGETCRLPGRRGTKDLKKLFQEAGIPPWVRERTPLIYLDGHLAAVGELCVCQPFTGPPGGPNIAIRWLVSQDANNGIPPITD